MKSPETAAKHPRNRKPSILYELSLSGGEESSKIVEILLMLHGCGRCFSIALLGKPPKTGKDQGGSPQ